MLTVYGARLLRSTGKKWAKRNALIEAAPVRNTRHYRQIATHPDHFDFCPFFGVDRNRGLSPGASPIPFLAMQID